MRRGDEQGQAVVEFTLIASLLAAILLACFQFGVAFTDYITVTDAARAAARRASTDGTTMTLAAATLDAQNSAQVASGHTCTKDSWCTTVTTNPGGASGWKAGNGVVATVSAPYSISIVGFTVASGMLTHSVTMRIEGTS